MVIILGIANLMAKILSLRQPHPLLVRLKQALGV